MELIVELVRDLVGTAFAPGVSMARRVAMPAMPQVAWMVDGARVNTVEMDTALGAPRVVLQADETALRLNGRLLQDNTTEPAVRMEAVRGCLEDLEAQYRAAGWERGR